MRSTRFDRDHDRLRLEDLLDLGGRSMSWAQRNHYAAKRKLAEKTRLEGEKNAALREKARIEYELGIDTAQLDKKLKEWRLLMACDAAQKMLDNAERQLKDM